MKHIRPDYDRIQDPEGKIPDNEPVFMIRAQDVSAGDTVREWARLNLLNGGDPVLSAAAHVHALRMDAWPKKKAPDLPESSVEEIGRRIERADWDARCGRCGHQAHEPGACLCGTSDGDCDCRGEQ